MTNKRILVVDDSCFYQRLLSDVINARPGLEVVGVAPNGRVALEMTEKLRPDLLTLDILMPEMDGIQTLIELRKHWPEVRSIMVSSLTPEGSDAALDALALGANEYAMKPSSSITDVRYKLQEDLIPKLEALCGLDVNHVPESTKSVDAVTIKSRCQSPVFEKSAAPVQIIAIGVSTGGPEALGKLLPALPSDLGVPILIVQHMPAEFTAKLANRLNDSCALQVVEAEHGDKPKPGVVYIAPGGFHMVLEASNADVRVSLNENPPENSCRPSVDPLFRSLSSIYADQCLGVVMTGMGRDGLKGAEALYAQDARILVQDQESSIVWGMPKLVAMAGLAEKQVPLSMMAEEIVSCVRQRVDDRHITSKVKKERSMETVCMPGMRRNL